MRQRRAGSLALARSFRARSHRDAGWRHVQYLFALSRPAAHDEIGAGALGRLHGAHLCDGHRPDLGHRIDDRRRTGSAAVMIMGNRPPATPVSDTGGFDKDSPLGKLETWSKHVEAAGAENGGGEDFGRSERRSRQAMRQLMAAALRWWRCARGGLAAGAAAKGFVPATLDGPQRTQIPAERNSAVGIQVSCGQRHLSQ